MKPPGYAFILMFFFLSPSTSWVMICNSLRTTLYHSTHKSEQAEPWQHLGDSWLFPACVPLSCVSPPPVSLLQLRSHLLPITKCSSWLSLLPCWNESATCGQWHCPNACAGRWAFQEIPKTKLHPVKHSKRIRPKLRQHLRDGHNGPNVKSSSPHLPLSMPVLTKVCYDGMQDDLRLSPFNSHVLISIWIIIKKYKPDRLIIS